MTEREVRERFANQARAYLECNEADGTHKRIIDLYNTLPKLPRSVPMSYTMPWCAAYVSAVGVASGLDAIVLPECSCSKMLALYRAAGRFVEDDNYLPSIGDLVLYDWEDSGAGDNKGSPDHVGIVLDVCDEVLTIIEGNLENAVKLRSLPRNSRYIRGYCLPDFASMATAPAKPAPKPKLTPKYGKSAQVSIHLLVKGNQGEEVRALQTLLLLRGFDVGADGADGIFGANTEKAVKAAQKHYKLAVDGKAGAKTFSALWTG